MNGPKVFFTILEKVYSPSVTKTNRLKADLRSMDITSYPGENVTLYVGDAMPLVREIKMNSMDVSQHMDLAIDCLQGLRKSSDPFLAHKVHDLVMANNSSRVNKFGTKKADPIEVLLNVENYYKLQMDSESYGPAASIKNRSPAALQAQIGTLGQQTRCFLHHRQ